MKGLRMLTVQIEVDGRTLGGNELLIPFIDALLGENSCRHISTCACPCRASSTTQFPCDSGGSKINVLEAARDHQEPLGHAGIRERYTVHGHLGVRNNFVIESTVFPF
jgi:hypothetical protein